MKKIDKVLQKYGLGWSNGPTEKYHFFNQAVLVKMDRLRYGDKKEIDKEVLLKQVFIELFDESSGSLVINDAQLFFQEGEKQSEYNQIPDEMKRNFRVEYLIDRNQITPRVIYINSHFYDKKTKKVKDFADMLEYELTEVEKLKSMFSAEEKKKINVKHFVSKTMLIKKEIYGAQKIRFIGEELKEVTDAWAEKLYNRYNQPETKTN